MEKDIEELRALLHVQAWDVMGHSGGGLIMTAYARDYPQQVRSLVYVHCTLDLNSSLNSHIVNGIRLLKETGDNYHPDPKLSKFDQMMNVHMELAKKGIEYKIMFRSQREKDIEDSLINAIGRCNQDFNRRIWTLPDYQPDFARYTKDIACPVLIITGSKDYAVGPDSYKSWQFKNKKVVIYDGGHTSYQEEPAWFVDTVLPFLQHTSL